MQTGDSYFTNLQMGQYLNVTNDMYCICNGVLYRWNNEEWIVEVGTESVSQ